MKRFISMLAVFSVSFLLLVGSMGCTTMAGKGKGYESQGKEAEKAADRDRPHPPYVYQK
ncbi:MAG: entericidin A/B family lipoprotein [Thermodesulfobacteriota bacterium]